MTITMGRLVPTANETAVDYGPLMGFGMPTVPVNPHTHIAQPPAETNLREVVDLLRSRQAAADTSSSSP
jgi:hypothetical protein